LLLEQLNAFTPINLRKIQQNHKFQQKNVKKIKHDTTNQSIQHQKEIRTNAICNSSTKNNLTPLNHC